VRVFVDYVRALRFDDGTPLTAASGIAPLGDGWLIAQDDSTFAAWRRAGSVVPVRVLPPVEGHDRFSEAAGTKRLKPIWRPRVRSRSTASRPFCSWGRARRLGACGASSSG
jgi:hypothetical protein